MYTDVDYRGPWFHCVSTDESRHSGCHDEDVGLPAYRGEVSGARMADCHGGVSL